MLRTRKTATMSNETSITFGYCDHMRSKCFLTVSLILGAFVTLVATFGVLQHSNSTAQALEIKAQSKEITNVTIRLKFLEENQDVLLGKQSLILQSLVEIASDVRSLAAEKERTK
jgi:hypothetical protein